MEKITRETGVEFFYSHSLESLHEEIKCFLMGEGGNIINLYILKKKRMDHEALLSWEKFIYPIGAL